ncbi:hypothetical protein D1AOALGA4SA_6926 [Olavius algarvensis Delta 1 endosymbiont]|nr:hypothetical protein D1AOALGA4SA_6926 [Olavius algarvensis Delta 1 endosymbiont]
MHHNNVKKFQPIFKIRPRCFPKKRKMTERLEKISGIKPY